MTAPAHPAPASGGLLPCPHCGCDKPYFCTDTEEENHGHLSAISCLTCHATMYGTSRERAAEKWNTRPAPPAQAGRTEAVGVREELAGRLESLAEILTTDPAITDTIWARDGVTLYEALGEVADDIRQMPAHEAPKITDERVAAFREAAFHTYGHCDIRAGLTAALAQPTAMAKPENGCPKCGSETCDGMCDCYLDESAAAQLEPTGADAVESAPSNVPRRPRPDLRQV